MNHNSGLIEEKKCYNSKCIFNAYSQTKYHKCNHKDFGIKRTPESCECPICYCNQI